MIFLFIFIFFSEKIKTGKTNRFGDDTLQKKDFVFNIAKKGIKEVVQSRGIAMGA